MSELIEAVERLKVPYESSDSGEWVRYPCPEGKERYVIHGPIADGYVAWCEGHGDKLEWSLHLENLIQPGTPAGPALLFSSAARTLPGSTEIRNRR